MSPISPLHAGGHPDRSPGSPPRVLLPYMESTGAGHRRAAEAVEKVLRRDFAPIDTATVNLLDYSSGAIRDAYHEMRASIIREAPHFLGQLYAWYDRPRDPKRSIFDRALLAFQRFTHRELLDILKGGSFDAIVNTHFFAAELCASLRRDGKIRAPLFTVTTDYLTHGMWISNPSEGYFVATREAVHHLGGSGVGEKDIHLTGIPVDPVFAEDKDISACRQRFGLDPEEGADPVVLLSTGGFSGETTREIARALLAVERPIQIVAVAGRSDDRRAALEQALSVPNAHRHRVQVLGFTDAMDELVRACDLHLTKAGGLTVAEGLSVGRPFAIVSPTPDQEAQNSDYLLEQGVAVRVHDETTLPFKIGTVVGDRERLGAMRHRARAIGRPRAAEDVARRVLEVAGRYWGQAVRGPGAEEAIPEE
ncbi:MAG TPA: glycosyltransferase [Polyangiaceae bacterium LLY-WYZ-14_1]|nr:glycosyltransferase [Polyangiaceae bacterium LLY-WYZ-14_1]